MTWANICKTIVLFSVLEKCGKKCVQSMLACYMGNGKLLKSNLNVCDISSTVEQYFPRNCFIQFKCVVGSTRYIQLQHYLYIDTTSGHQGLIGVHIRAHDRPVRRGGQSWQSAPLPARKFSQFIWVFREFMFSAVARKCYSIWVYH